jgi:hypothetical protein
VTLFREAAPGEDNCAHPERIPWMLEYIPEGPRVVEVGCGAGPRHLIFGDSAIQRGDGGHEC